MKVTYQKKPASLAVFSIITIVSLLLMSPNTAFAAIALDAASSVSTTFNASGTATISHTTGSGSNRFMWIGVSHRSDVAVETVTYGAQSAVFVGVGGTSPDIGRRAEIWRVINPTSGAGTVTVDGPTTLNLVDVFIGVTTWTGVDQTTPLGTFVSASAVGGTTLTVDVTSATGELVHDTAFCEGDCSAAGAGQTERWKIDRGGGSTEAGASTVTMSWTQVVPPDDWAIGAASIKPVAAAATAGVTRKMRLFEGFSVKFINGRIILHQK